MLICRLMGEVKVLGSYGSLFCSRIEWALKMKGVDYEYIEQDLMNKSPLLLKHNPVHKKVPVLVHHDKYSVSESLVILEYIEDSWKDAYPLLPQHPYDRAMARFWAKFIDEKCLMGAWEAYKSQGEEKEKAIEAALESLSFLEKQLQAGNNSFFGGEKVGFLDLVAGWIPLWLGVMEQVGEMKLLQPEKFPLLCDWAERFVEIAVIKECLPVRQDVVGYFSGYLVHLRSLDSTKP